MKKEEAIEVIEQDIPCEHDTDLIEALEMAIQALEQEPKIGHWVKHNTSSNTYYYDCSLCSCVAPCTETADSYLWKLSNYCPDCGARMVQESEKINCKSTKCENCINHNYCDYEPQEKRCEDCDHYGKLSLDCGRCDDDCSMFEPKKSEG